MNPRDNILYRYTSLPIVIDVLTNRHLTLLSPSSWPDRNDAFSLDLYKKEAGCSQVLAICFTTREETFHHWSVFSEGIAGARIEFRRDSLLEALVRKNLIIQEVEYREINQVLKKPVDLEKLPFIKRAPYNDEGELRAIKAFQDEKKEFHCVKFPLNCIDRITLSPSLPPSVAPSVKALLKRIKGCSDIKICRSTLLENSDWKSALLSRPPKIEPERQC